MVEGGRRGRKPQEARGEKPSLPRREWQGGESGEAWSGREGSAGYCVAKRNHPPE